jgi:hypothetical protein
VPNPEQLRSFVDWFNRCITGDEKGQAQIFLDRLFQGFGLQGSLDVGGSPEFRVLKSAEDGGGTSFADYVWKPVVLIEMKKCGEISRNIIARPSIIGRALFRTADARSFFATSKPLMTDRRKKRNPGQAPPSPLSACQKIISSRRNLVAEDCVKPEQ